MAMTVGLFGDVGAFFAAWGSGTDPEFKKKTFNCIRSAARIAFAAGVIWAMYKSQYLEIFRKLRVPVVLLSVKLARFSFSLEPFSVATNLYLIKTARSKLAVGVYLGVLQCIVQTLNQWKAKQPPTSLSVSLRRATLQVDPFSSLMNIALVKIPEARLGIGLYTLLFGIFQVSVYTSKRWNLIEAPTNWALKGILHITFGLGWLGLYEKYSRDLEKDNQMKETFFYKIADKLTPAAAWLVSGK